MCPTLDPSTRPPLAAGEEGTPTRGPDRPRKGWRRTFADDPPLSAGRRKLLDQLRRWGGDDLAEIGPTNAECGAATGLNPSRASKYLHDLAKRRLITIRFAGPGFQGRVIGFPCGYAGRPPEAGRTLGALDKGPLGALDKGPLPKAPRVNRPKSLPLADMVMPCAHSSGLNSDSNGDRKIRNVAEREVSAPRTGPDAETPVHPPADAAPAWTEAERDAAVAADFAALPEAERLARVVAMAAHLKRRADPNSPTLMGAVYAKHGDRHPDRFPPAAPAAPAMRKVYPSARPAPAPPRTPFSRALDAARAGPADPELVKAAVRDLVVAIGDRSPRPTWCANVVGRVLDGWLPQDMLEKTFVDLSRRADDQSCTNFPGLFNAALTGRCELLPGANRLRRAAP